MVAKAATREGSWRVSRGFSPLSRFIPLLRCISFCGKRYGFFAGQPRCLVFTLGLWYLESLSCVQCPRNYIKARQTSIAVPRTFPRSDVAGSSCASGFVEFSLTGRSPCITNFTAGERPPWAPLQRRPHRCLVQLISFQLQRDGGSLLLSRLRRFPCATGSVHPTASDFAQLLHALPVPLASGVSPESPMVLLRPASLVALLRRCACRLSQGLRSTRELYKLRYLWRSPSYSVAKNCIL